LRADAPAFGRDEASGGAPRDLSGIAIARPGSGSRGARHRGCSSVSANSGARSIERPIPEEAPLTQLAAAETVIPAMLDTLARRTLEDELYGVHSRIFRGVDRDAFVAYVIDSKAEHTWIQLYRDRAGALGGYMAVHIYERVIDGRMTAIVRGEMGTLREHRGANLCAAFFAERVIRYLAAHPLRPLYLLASFVHPSSYVQLVRYHDD